MPVRGIIMQSHNTTNAPIHATYVYYAVTPLNDEPFQITSNISPLVET